MMLSNTEETGDVKPKALDAQKKAQEVADLERRLADLSTASIAPVPATAPAPAMDPFAPKQAPAPAATKPSAAGGKSALLARIMAAQERAKQSQPTGTNATAQPPAFASPPPAFAAAPPAMDLKPPPPAFAAPPTQSFAAPPPAFSSMAPPAPSGPAPTMDFLSMGSTAPAPAAPPAFDQSFLPPPTAAAPPPAFDLMAPPPAAAAPPAMQFDPMAALAPPSAPAFEDLMMDPPPAAMPPPIQPPPPAEAASGGLDEETLQAIMAMDGMSEADKQSLIDEQLKIMKSIESKKNPPPVSAADAFEQRSFSAAVQAASKSSSVQMHGQEQTQAAIQDGTAVMVQCTSCENWMQVTGAAQLMFCPVCQTVTPVVRADGASMPQEDADQMAADLRLAEQLQKEEYAAAEQQQTRQTRTAAQPAAASSSSSWMGWLGFGSPAPAPARQDEEISFSRSGESSLQGGQTAGQAPLFACVTDSINNAANYAMSLQEDEEGNVHGVDASSLLAVPQVGRNTDKSN